MTKFYPETAASPDFPKLEQEVLESWKAGGTFKKSVASGFRLQASEDVGLKPEARSLIPEYVFYDGPPFANGLPHYGHLLTGFVKDIFARYHTMKGSKVERRFGWDCHGLPAEMAAEKELGVSGRANIEKFGIQKFNDHCRTSVMKYAKDWEQYVTRQARWVDFENDYKTMNRDYMESVMWAFKTLYDKGLIYESHRVMPYSWAMETPVSNFETRMDNAYREREDRAVYVAFKLNEKPKGAPEAKEYYLVAWTTTPWTLPSNLGLAVNPKAEYACIEKDGKCYILAPTAASIIAESDNRIIGSSLIGASYHPLFPYFSHLALPNRETARCLLRPLAKADLEALVSLHTHPEVAKTTYDGMQSPQQVAEHLEGFIAHQQQHGYSQWAVHEKTTGRFIGRAGLTLRALDKTQPPRVELRLALLPEFWHQGYATELSQMWLDFAFHELGVDIVAAAAHPENIRSHTMLKKQGFTHVKDLFFTNGGNGPYFTLAKTEYKPLQKIQYKTRAGAFRVLDGSSFIEEGSGTGVVHLAPGFGEDDQRVCAENGIEIVCPVDSAGKYTDEIFDLPDLSLKGLNVVADVRKNADEPYTDSQLSKYGLVNLRIIAWLKLHGQLIKQEDIKHNYPHCWRTDTPLIYRALPSWYVEVTKFNQRMVELNQQINWIPAHIKDGRFGKWLEGARDWSISRNRYWGSPIPVWKNEKGDVKVFGSIAELESFFGVKVEDLHRPFIDSLTKDGWTRVTDVFDCWFESGSMPFAQVHYPFENKDWFETHFPADFIVEYEAQTRGWFYTLMVLATALFDKPPFKNVICHGVVLDEKGQKLSKRLNNYADPLALMDQYGADALRWRMVSSPIMQGGELLIAKDGSDVREISRLIIKPIWNAYHFFTLYANADEVKGSAVKKTENVMDSYIVTKAMLSVAAIEHAMDAYDVPSACKAGAEFFDALNNWYIRRSRDRFWKAQKDADKQAAYDTLYTVLSVMMRALAPLLPLTTEAIYRGLTNDESVHLTAFPYDAFVHAKDMHTDIVASMDKVREVCTAALSIRNNEQMRVRQPLASLTIVHKQADDMKPYADIIADELNVKEVKFVEGVEEYATHKIQPNFAVLGKRLKLEGKEEKMKQIIPAIKKGEYKFLGRGEIAVCGETLRHYDDEYTALLEPKNKQGTMALPAQDGLVVLDLSLTPALKTEGYARDIIRMVQQARKDAGLQITDHITLTFKGDAELEAAFTQWQKTIEEQTLAKASIAEPANANYKAEEEIEGKKADVGVTKA